MTETGQRRRLPTSERRQAILAAAMDLFSQRGYEAVGMRDVAKVCGLSAPGIYRHFASKEALLIGLVDRRSDTMSAAMREASRVDSAHQQLAYLVGFHVGLVVREPAMIPIYQREDASLPPRERDRFRAVQRDYVAAWTRALEQLDPTLSSDVARTTVLATYGTMNSIALHTSRLSPQALEKLGTELAWRTLGHSP